MSIWLDRAVEHGDLRRIRESFTSVDTPADALAKLHTCGGDSVLTLAVQSNQLKSLEQLLKEHKKFGITVDIKSKREQSTALHVAVKEDKLDFVAELIHHGAFVSSKDKHGKTPLHCAVELRIVEAVKILVENGANVKAQSRSGHTPLSLVQNDKDSDIRNLIMNSLVTKRPNTNRQVGVNVFLAVSKGDKKLLEKIIAKSKPVLNGCSSKGQSPLYLACKHGFRDMVEYLVSQGVDVGIQNVSGTSPLHVAVEYRHAHVVKYLVHRGVNLHIRNLEGKQPIDVAISKEDFEMIDILLPGHLRVFKNYAQSNDRRFQWILRQACKIGRTSTAQFIVEQQAFDINDQTSHGWTALHIATRFQSAEIVELLLKNGADPNVPTEAKWTAAHICCTGEDKELRLKIMTMLASHGADLTLKTSFGFCPIHFAAKNGDVPLLTFLCENSTTTNEEDKNGWAPLAMALKGSNKEAVGCLLSHNATISNTQPFFDACRQADDALIEQFLRGFSMDVNFKGKDGWTVLGIAVLKEVPIEVVAKIVEKGADVNWKGKLGFTPLHTAVTMSNVPMVQLLCQSKANVEAPNSLNYTPLHTALLTRNAEVFKILLSHGADPKKKFPNSEHPLLRTAMMMECIEMVDLLATYGADCNANSGSEYSLLHHAAIKMKSLEMCRTLLKHKANPNGLAHGKSCLHYLASKMNDSKGAELAKCLLDHGADANLQNAEGRTALHTAADNRNLNVLRALFSDTKTNKHPLDRWHWTPLHSVIEKGYEEIVDLFLANGSDINAVTAEGWSILDIAVLKNNIPLIERLIQMGVRFDIGGRKSGSALSFAIKKDKKEAAALLSKHGAKLDLKALHTENEWSVLHSVCLSDDLNLATILVEAGLDINGKDQNGWTPLHVAAINMSLQVFNYLLEKGADGSIPNNIGWTTLHTAANLSKPKQLKKGSPELVKVLLGKLGPNVKEQKGLTPLDVAISANNSLVVQYLTEKGAQSTKYKIFERVVGWNVLHECAYHGWDAVIPVLSKFQNVNEQELAHNWTPLHMAARKGYAKVCKTLMACGADATLQDSEGKTALFYTVERKSRDAMKEIIKGGGGNSLHIKNEDGVAPLDIANSRSRSSPGQYLKKAVEKSYQNHVQKIDHWDRPRKNKDGMKRAIKEDWESQPLTARYSRR